MPFVSGHEIRDAQLPRLREELLQIIMMDLKRMEAGFVPNSWFDWTKIEGERNKQTKRMVISLIRCLVQSMRL
jgi:hypothetical protein